MARVPESAFAAAALRQCLAFDQLRALHARDGELSDAIAALDRDGLLSEIGEDHAELAAVVAVDGAGAVQAGDALAQRQAGARPDLAFESLRDGDRKEETLFIDATVWDRQADLCAQYLSKGRKVAVEGRLRSHSWEDEGQKRSLVEVVANRVEFLSPPQELAEVVPFEPAAAS